MSGDESRLPKIARYKPYYRELEQGRAYFWCSCGLSQSQPFCDGSHAGTSFRPVKYVAKEPGEEVLFCGCKHSAAQPMCDGAHNNLRGTYETDDPNSDANRAIPELAPAKNGRTVLDGGCFVADMSRITLERHRGLSFGQVISPATHALYQSQYYFELTTDDCPIIAFGASEVVIFFQQGAGVLQIADRSFEFEPCSGAYVSAGESFSLRSDATQPIKCFVSVCPADAQIQWLDQRLNAFAEDKPTRVVPLSDENRTPMADRFFQMLVSPETGCTSASQFIGEIPQSKAAMHRHLYEESLIVVSGAGQMWTESARTRVKAGDVIFLPRKQIHSLECTDPDGMLVAGVIHPGDNPAVNY